MGKYDFEEERRDWLTKIAPDAQKYFGEQFAMGGITVERAIQLVRDQFFLTNEEAMEVVREAKMPAFDVPPINSDQELKNFLRNDGRGFLRPRHFWNDPRAAIELLRDVLRCSRDVKESILTGSHEKWAKAYRRLGTILCCNNLDELDQLPELPGFGTWFLSVLEDRNLIEYDDNYIAYPITPRGEEVLAAVEHWYPPPAEA